MAETDRQKLERHLCIIETWTRERIPDEIIHSFTVFDQCSREENKDLWKKIRHALAENKWLNDKVVREYICIKGNDAGGNWWWNCKNWKKDK